MSDILIDKHSEEIIKNLNCWNSKPVLKKIYGDFYRLIATYIRHDISGKIVEIGSGIGNLKTVIPQCICTDLFSNPWIDQVENAYELSFDDESISNIILFDVWHHLEFPGTALHEFDRVLTKGGRVIIFEPVISLLGLIIYGLFYHEPVKLTEDINWYMPEEMSSENAKYYAAQSNATRIFFTKKYNDLLLEWKCVYKRLITSISYVASGGYSKPQLFPTFFLPFMYLIDRMFSFVPWLFATRLIIVLEKK